MLARRRHGTEVGHCPIEGGKPEQNLKSVRINAKNADAGLKMTSWDNR
jgi:hypothetical protein